MRGAVCTGLASALIAHAAFAGPLAPSKSSDIVTLTTGPGDACVVTGSAAHYRVLPDGTRELFSVPDKRVLVVTGIDFVTQVAVPIDVELFVEKAPESAQIFVTGVAAGGGSAAIPNAIVGSGATLCVRGTQKDGGAVAVLAVVHGFVAKDK